MSTSDNGDEITDEDLRQVVFGDLEVPGDAVVGEWVRTPHGILRDLTFPPIYEEPGIGTVELLGQQAQNGEIRYGVRINVNGDVSTELASLIKAAIGDAVSNAESLNGESAP